MCEIPTAFSTTTRKAIKRHKCCECKKLIEIGEQYQYSSGIWDSQPDSYKQCLNCYEIMVAAAHVADYSDEGPSFTGLRDWLTEFRYAGSTDREWLDEVAEKIEIAPEKLHLLLRVSANPVP